MPARHVYLSARSALCPLGTPKCPLGTPKCPLGTGKTPKKKGRGPERFFQVEAEVEGEGRPGLTLLRGIDRKKKGENDGEGVLGHGHASEPWHESEADQERPPGPARAPRIGPETQKQGMVLQGKKNSLSAIHHREGRARALLMLLWMLLLMLLWMLLLMQLLMLLLMPKTLPRYPKPCPATRSLVPLPETSLALYPKPCPATRSLVPLPETLPRYPKPCPATRDLLSSLPEALPRYPKPCPATRNLAPLPEALSRYPKLCPATRSLARNLARNLAPLPEALPLPEPVLLLVLLRSSPARKSSPITAQSACKKTPNRFASCKRPRRGISIGVLVKNPDFQ